jgi:excinuclease UvrABC ATPase subunit
MTRTGTYRYVLAQVGLGCPRLGQSATTLSGGEALARYLLQQVLQRLAG